MSYLKAHFVKNCWDIY